MSGSGKRASGAPNGVSSFSNLPQSRGAAKNKILGDIVGDIFTTTKSSSRGTEPKGTNHGDRNVGGK